MPGDDKQQFVVLPRRGVRATSGPSRAAMLDLYAQLGVSDGAFEMAQAPVTVIDSINEDGPKLVELDSISAARLNNPDSPVRAVPIVEYPRPDPIGQLASFLTLAQPAAGGTAMTVTCNDAQTGAPIVGASVVAFTNFAARQAARGETDADGKVVLRLAAEPIERLYVIPAGGYWGGFRSNLPVANVQIPLEPIDLNYVDLVRHYYGASRFDPATGVRVGIVDTGCGPHTDLNLLGGVCTVTGDLATSWQDVDIHGTHVAGLVGAATGIRGVAPNVGLWAFRVFPSGQAGATNYAILKALIRAADHNCDVVNLSLGGGPFDEIVEEAIADACNQGMLPIIAAGNDGRQQVNYPAAHRRAVAVAAMGREGSFPAGSSEEAEILRPPSSTNDPQAFIAAFSNVGPQIAIAGAGVGVLSTLPNNGYGPLSGTSMAAPVVAGAAASLLSQNPEIYGMVRDRARSDAIRNLLQQNCVRLGFGSAYEGYGIPDPQVV